MWRAPCSIGSLRHWLPAALAAYNMAARSIALAACSIGSLQQTACSIRSLQHWQPVALAACSIGSLQH